MAEIWERKSTLMSISCLDYIVSVNCIIRTRVLYNLLVLYIELSSLSMNFVKLLKLRRRYDCYLNVVVIVVFVFVFFCIEFEFELCLMEVQNDG